MRPSGKARLAGVIGYPIGHSLSPRIHAHWLDACGIDGAYVPLAVQKQDFSIALRGLRTAGFVGANVTIPHKEAAFAIAEHLDEPAHATGAINLLLFRDGRLEGRNTDVQGLVSSLTEAVGADGLRGEAVVVLGAGGAARAAVLALGTMGAREVRVVARNAARADALLRAGRSFAGSSLGRFTWDGWPQAASGAALVLNATSAGMAGNAALDLSLELLPASAAVCDIVYNPLETPLLKEARHRGHRAIDGLGMLMHQAAPAFEAFYGILPAVTPYLRAELEGALRER